MKIETQIESPAGMNTERMAHLERDRWPEFERELRMRRLRMRRLRKIHFDLCRWSGERPRWGWMINRCRKWDEVERVLNRHNVSFHWQHRRAVLELDDAEVYRLS